MNLRSNPSVFVSIVSRNEAAVIQNCLDSLRNQTIGLRTVVFDNGSHDETVEIAERNGIPVKRSYENLGYSRGHNCNLEGEAFDYALLLNADVVLEPDYLERVLVAALSVDRAGMVGGKLFRMGRNGKPLVQNGRPVLDSAGMIFTPAQRHFDRGSNQQDQGQYERRQLVFGITGAALFCSREMLEDLKVDGEVLDEDFFSYREDADLAWRAQLRGWNAVYEPLATASHLRVALPSKRASLDPLINYHSLKNRYLMRTKNMDWAVWRKCFPYLWLRDVGCMGYVLLRERTSLAAYRKVWELRERTSRKRQLIQQGRRVPHNALAKWFSFRPLGFDI